MKDEIAFDDFKKVDIRVGKILSVEVIPDADKLLKLEVDFGEETPRTIVSGIREYVADPGSLVGMQTTFVTNLPYREIRGIESQGMLFAVGGEQEFSFLRPDKGVLPGSPLI